MQHKKNARILPSAPQRSFSDAVRVKHTGARPQAHHRPVMQEPRSRPQPNHARPGKVLVQGARKIWGTMKNCTIAAVLGAISKLTPSISNLRVKRKYKSLSNNKIAWWFIIHGKRRNLALLKLNGRECSCRPAGPFNLITCLRMSNKPMSYAYQRSQRI